MYAAVLIFQKVVRLTLLPFEELRKAISQVELGAQTEVCGCRKLVLLLEP